MKKHVVIVLSVVILLAAVWALGSVVWGNPYVAKGRQLYNYYCAACHGAHGRPNEGYNWAQMPDPRPKDLSSKEEMATFKDEEIFATISRDMKDTTPEIGDKIGEEEFAVPTMPTFKYTLSEEEIWAIVAYVRTLHGMTLTYDLEGRKKQLENQVQAAQQAYDQAKQALETAERRAAEEAQQKGGQVEESVTAKEREAVAAAAQELERAKAALEEFSSRPKHAAPPRPELAMTAEEAARLTEMGKRLYYNKYGCNGCHRIGESGGVVGPALDRAGFRLNPTWIFRWVKYPQSMKPDTRMPTLGLSDQDAKAITMYLTTLRAPSPQPVQKVSN